MLSFAFLTFKEHPIARLMLANLIQSGFIPQLIVEELSSFGEKKKTIYQSLSEQLKAIPSMEQLIKTHHIDAIEVDNINNTNSENKLRSLQPQ